MNEDEAILNNQVHIVSVKSGLRSDVVLYLLQQGWSYVQTMGKPDQWVKNVYYPKFKLDKPKTYAENVRALDDFVRQMKAEKAE